MILINNHKFSSNINEVIRPVLNFLFFIFFTKRAQNRLQQTKTKNVYKKTSK